MRGPFFWPLQCQSHRWLGLLCAVASDTVCWSNTRAPALLSSVSDFASSAGDAASIAANVNQQPFSSLLQTQTSTLPIWTQPQALPEGQPLYGRQRRPKPSDRHLGWKDEGVSPACDTR